MDQTGGHSDSNGQSRDNQATSKTVSSPVDSVSLPGPDSTGQEEAKPERKITQTDHINKKLLGAFLDRLNQGDNSVAFGLDPQPAFDEEDEFVDRTDSLSIIEKSDSTK